jgi:hypothetical protein
MQPSEGTDGKSGAAEEGSGAQSVQEQGAVGRKARKEKKAKKKKQKQKAKGGSSVALEPGDKKALVNVQRAGVGEVVLVVTGKSVNKKSGSGARTKAKRRKMNRDAPLGQALLVMEGLEEGGEGELNAQRVAQSQQEWATLLVEQRELMLELEETTVGVHSEQLMGEGGGAGEEDGEEDGEGKGGEEEEEPTPEETKVASNGNGHDADEGGEILQLQEYEGREYYSSASVASAVIKAKTASSLATFHDAIESERDERDEEGVSRVFHGVKIIHLGIGPITESDITLASAARSAGRDCQVFGLQVRANAGMRRLAKRESVHVETAEELPAVLDALRELGRGRE